MSNAELAVWESFARVALDRALEGVWRLPVEASGDVSPEEMRGRFVGGAAALADGMMAEREKRRGVQAMGHQAQAYPGRRWMPVGALMPDADRHVLVMEDGNGAMLVGYWDGEDWREVDFGTEISVTHWRELPEPPEQNEKKEGVSDDGGL